MSNKLTLKKFETEFETLRKYRDITPLFGSDNHPPLIETDLIQALEEKNQIGKFCEIVFHLQGPTLSSCLDEYQFHLEYGKEGSKKNVAPNFSRTDAEKIFKICKEHKRLAVFMIGVLLYRDYEPYSILKFYRENPSLTDTRPESEKYLAQKKALDRRNEKMIWRDKEYNKIISAKPFRDSTITNKLTFSLFSRWDLNFNIKHLDSKLSTFWHYICLLQTVRKDLDIFNKDDFEPFIQKCFNERNDLLYKEAADNERNRELNELNKEHLNDLLKDADHYRELYGEAVYYEQVQYYTKATRNPIIIEDTIGEYLDDLIIKKLFEFYPNEQECTDLWSMYNAPNAPKKENALLNSIASLLHCVPEKEYDRILAYYLIPEKRIKLAERPILDRISDDKFIIHPKLARPIDKNIIYHLTHRANRYNGAKYKKKFDEADKIVFRWLIPENNNSEKLSCFIHIVLNLQISSIEIIKQDVFSKTFDKQIQDFKAGKPYLPPNNDDFFWALEQHHNDKDDLLRVIAILIEEGYKYRDIADYYKI